MEIKRIEHECMRCSAYFAIDKSVCKDGMNCPACKGPIKVTGFETVKVYADGKQINGPLLTIELQDETSAPKVFYKGEEVKLKQEVEFHWETDTDEYGGLSYAIEHAVEGKSRPTRNRIERRVKGHALI